MKAIPTQSTIQTLGAASYTSTGLGTCVGALFVGVRGDTADTAANGANFGIGAYDGSANRSCSVSSQNGVGATVDKSWPSNAQAFRLLGNAGAIDGEADGNGFTTDGVQLDVTDAFASADILTALLFAEGSCKVGSTTSFPSNGGTVLATPGFPAKVVFTFSNFASFGVAAAQADSNLSIGVAWNNNGTWENYCISHWADDAVATTATAAVTRNNRCLVNIAAGAVVSAVEITASTSTQFTITTRDTAVATQVGWLALGWTDEQPFWAGVVSSITTPSVTKSYTSPGFMLSSAGLLMSRCATINTIETDADGGPMNVAIIGGSGKESCYSIAEQDAVALGTTNTECLPSNDSVRISAHDGTLTTVANFSAWTATGVDLTVSATATDGTTRQWILWGWGNHRINATLATRATLTVDLTNKMAMSATLAVTSGLTCDMSLLTDFSVTMDADTTLTSSMGGKMDLSTTTMVVVSGMTVHMTDAEGFEATLAAHSTLTADMGGTMSMAATLAATSGLSCDMGYAGIAVSMSAVLAAHSRLQGVLGEQSLLLIPVGGTHVELTGPQVYVESWGPQVVTQLSYPLVEAQL